MTKRAVLYARVSGDDRSKEGRNLASQLEMGREYALSKGYTVVAELAEDERGASGADFDLPKLNEALEMARRREFDVLVAREPDRFARDLTKHLLIEREFKRQDVDVQYCLVQYENTPEGDLSKQIQATIAEYERKKINQRMNRGRRNKVKSGSVRVQGRPPFGYQEVKQGGKYLLEPDVPEAQVVKLIYTWYTDGDGKNGPMGSGDIARKLTDLAVPSYADRRQGAHIPKRRAKGVWSRTSVMRMLKNETYAGVWHYGKNSSSEVLTVEVPPLVSRKVWEMAQAQRTRNQALSKRNTKRRYLVSKRVVCGSCGHKMSASSTVFGNGREYLYYRCTVALHKRDYDVTCDARGFRVDHVDPIVWEWVRGWLTDPNELAKGLTEFQSRQDEEKSPLRQRLELVDTLLEDNRGEMERLLDLYLSGDFPKEMLTTRKTQYEATMGTLEREQATLTAQLESMALTATEIEKLQNFTAQVAEGLDRFEDDFKGRRRIIDALDITVRLGVEDGQKVAHTTSVLGEGVLCIANTNTLTLCRPHSTANWRVSMMRPPFEAA